MAVPRPGNVSWEGARALIADAEMEAASTGILSRGRTYARAGQVVAIRVAPQQFTAQVQGSSDEPYEVALRAVTISGSARTDASCDCPYSCDFGWCKHAAALAYVAAHLLDTDLGCRATWLGQEPGESPTAQLAPLPAELLARLTRPIRAGDPQKMLAMATAIVPVPAGLPTPPQSAPSDEPRGPEAGTAPADSTAPSTDETTLV